MYNACTKNNVFYSHNNKSHVPHTLIIPQITQKEGTSIPKQLMIFSDGGARGNPGPAAIGFLILSENGQVLLAKSRYLGSRTNNQAEYEALIAALESAAELQAIEVTCHLDSQLVVKQLTGEYGVKNFELRKLWRKVQNLKKAFQKTSFVSVPRTNVQIQKADALVNEVLDQKFS